MRGGPPRRGGHPDMQDGSNDHMPPRMRGRGVRGGMRGGLEDREHMRGGFEPIRGDRGGRGGRGAVVERGAHRGGRKYEQDHQEDETPKVHKRSRGG